MVIFSSGGSFTTSTPIQKQHDSGFCENSPPSRNLSQATTDDESDISQLRKRLFGKRKASENIPENQFSPKHMILASIRSFSRRGPCSNEETPRAVRSYAGTDKPVCIQEAEALGQYPEQLFNIYTPPFKQSCDSGVSDETPESPKSVWFGTPLLPVIEKSLEKEKSKENSLACVKHALEAKNDDLSSSEMIYQYNAFRFQRMGLKAKSISFHERPMNDVNEESFILWKEKLERISAGFDKPIKIDFLNSLYNMNALIIVSDILSYLLGSDLQNASGVSRLWRKLVLEDKSANKTRGAYLTGRQKLGKEIEKKKEANPFQRPPNFRILGSIENIQKDRQFKKTVKEINFDAFIEVGKKKKMKPMKCPSCAKLSLQDKKAITKYCCIFCNYEFCSNCLKPYKSWHICTSTYLPPEKISINGKKYLRRL